MAEIRRSILTTLLTITELKAYLKTGGVCSWPLTANRSGTRCCWTDTTAFRQLAIYHRNDCPDVDNGESRAALTIATINHCMVAGCQVPNGVTVPSLVVS